MDFADECAEKIEDRAPVIGVIINGKAGGGGGVSIGYFNVA